MPLLNSFSIPTSQAYKNKHWVIRLSAALNGETSESLDKTLFYVLKLKLFDWETAVEFAEAYQNSQGFKKCIPLMWLNFLELFSWKVSGRIYFFSVGT